MLKNFNNFLFASSTKEHSLSLHLSLPHLLSDRIKSNIYDICFTFDLLLKSLENHPFMKNLQQLTVDRVQAWRLAKAQM